MKNSINLMMFLLILGSVPTKLYAVDATVTVSKDNLDGTFTQVGNPFTATGNPASLEIIGLPLNCSSGDDVCVSIDPGSQAQFLTDGGNLGQLILSPFIVTNIGVSPVKVQVDYSHKHAGADGSKAQCAAMSLDGWFTAADGIGTGDFVNMSMSVAWEPCTGKSCGPFKIGAQGSTPCPNTLGGQAQANGTCNGGPCLSHNAEDDLFYFPPTPPQIVNLLPAACNNCDPQDGSSKDIKAVLTKHYEVRLGSGDSNNTVGTGLGLIDQCGDPKKATARRNAVCTNANVSEIVDILDSQQIVINIHNANADTKQGQMQIDIFDNLAFKCSTDVDYATLRAEAEFNSPGAPLKSVSFQSGFCRTQFDVTALGNNFTCNTRWITLLQNGNILSAGPFSCPPQ